jgi:predicted nucleic acid-binding protein
MKKLKIYLDTSVISHLDQQDSPERMAETHLLWEDIKANKYDVIISDVVIAEINNCEDLKRDVLYGYLGQVQYTLVEIDDRTSELADKFVTWEILKESSLDDCRHIAAAITNECDMIISWNFKHVVRHKTIAGVKAITTLEGYKELLIYSPSSIIGGD